ncbi:TonB-dependent receptor domain-containing protein [Novosphingobium sp. TH158]|uniref:TonB-dependent receptor domain-containing protein n=1 Tax=Novosphingobium sp. TH158 TaxID=2067455 RepID=UPI000C79F577|nr:TonB-dependent receptor [Novosphingobium sp. TH158]PLK24387.1 TonB-dependent receptor [Novosphingobium sp. TH158]
MGTIRTSSVKALAFSASAIAMLVATPGWAQDAAAQAPAQSQEPDCTPQADGTLPDGCANGEILVTGSRIKRDTYSSPSPLQVLETDATQDVGQFDPTQILQRSEASAGQQIDATFGGFVLNNGPGSTTINLRGLGADRTLLLINGRRMAPAGVEGAPTNPSLNLLPGSLIERYELLLDGASSVYGSDAIAGVGNVILKKRFNGLELFARGNANPQGGGDDYTISGSWGKNFNNGFIGIGAEYDYRDTVRLNDRDFFSGCDRNYEITNTGEIRTLGLADNAAVRNRTPGVTVKESECKVTGISGRIFIPLTNLGSVYYKPGSAANLAIPNFSESTNAAGRDLDLNGDGKRDVDFQDVNTNAADLDQVFLSQQKLFNVMAVGEYTFPGEANLTTFFEANYSRAEIFADNTGTPQLFPYLPDINPFNPCFRTQHGGSGVDCRAADNTLNNRGLSTGFSLPVQPIVAVRGDRNGTDVKQEQYRGVLGLRGNLPFIAPSWSFELAGTYSRAVGRSVRYGIREDKLALALGMDPTADYNGDGIVDNNGDGIADDYDPNFEPYARFGDTQVIGVCNVAGLANPSKAMADLAQGCVPVNMLAGSLLGSAIGDFATQAERNYLFGTRVFNTVYEQTLLSGFVTGDLFKLPAGDVGVVLGAEWRRDKIDSRPDDIAKNGLFFGFFQDSGAVGAKNTKEAFAELDIPLIADVPGIRELNFNVSGRLTDDQFYGTNGTYSIKATWRPINQLRLKFSYGSSFRAPNLRENFLLGQSGFNTLFDPCAVPTDAFVGNVYNASLDTREQTTLDNCRREGRDPTRVGIDPQNLNTIQSSSVEITTGGTLDIKPETSNSLTAGFAFEETFGNGFDVAVGFNYYDIKLKDSIIEPSSQFIINDCYTRDDGQRSPFCDRIVTDPTAAGRFLISELNSGFINLNKERVRGIDINASLSKEVELFGKNIDLGLNLRANHLIERSDTFVDDVGVETYDDDAGEFGLPKWTGRATFTADIDKFRFTWETRYIGPVAQDPDGVDPFSDVFGRGPDGRPTGVTGDTCLGNGSGTYSSSTQTFTANGRVPGDNVFCRDVGFAKRQFLHTASLRYRSDSWTARVGVSNIFNTRPPLVDSSEVLAIGNTAIGNGYDYDGREFFFTLEKKF